MGCYQCEFSGERLEKRENVVLSLLLGIRNFCKQCGTVHVILCWGNELPWSLMRRTILPKNPLQPFGVTLASGHLSSCVNEGGCIAQFSSVSSGTTFCCFPLYFLWTLPAEAGPVHQLLLAETHLGNMAWLHLSFAYQLPGLQITRFPSEPKDCGESSICWVFPPVQRMLQVMQVGSTPPQPRNLQSLPVCGSRRDEDTGWAKICAVEAVPHLSLQLQRGSLSRSGLGSAGWRAL